MYSVGGPSSRGGHCKLADDLFCGLESPDELCENWKRLLQCLKNNSLTLSAPKTMKAPAVTTIL